VYKIWGWKAEGKRPLERLRHKWEDVIETDLRKLGWWIPIGFLCFWIGIGGMLMNLQVP
jgi:hypothetical protein